MTIDIVNINTFNTNIKYFFKEIYENSYFNFSENNYKKDKFTDLLKLTNKYTKNLDIKISEEYIIDFTKASYIMCYDVSIENMILMYKCFLLVFIGDDIAEQDFDKLKKCIKENNLTYLSRSVGIIYEDILKNLKKDFRILFKSHIFEWLLGVYNYHLNTPQDNVLGLFPIRRATGGGFTFISILFNSLEDDYKWLTNNLICVNICEKQSNIIIGFNDIASSTKEMKERKFKNNDNLVLLLNEDINIAQNNMLKSLKIINTEKNNLIKLLKLENIEIPKIILEYDIRLNYWQTISKRYNKTLPNLKNIN